MALFVLSIELNVTLTWQDADSHAASITENTQCSF